MHCDQKGKNLRWQLHIKCLTVCEQFDAVSVFTLAKISSWNSDPAMFISKWDISFWI